MTYLQMPSHAFKTSQQGRGTVGKGVKRKSSEGGAGQPIKKSNVQVGPVNDTRPETASPEVESTPKKKYVEVTTLEKLQDVEQILLDLRGEFYM